MSSVSYHSCFGRFYLANFILSRQCISHNANGSNELGVKPARLALSAPVGESWLKENDVNDQACD